MSDKKIRVLFGLEAQGHIPLIEKKLKTWWPRVFEPNQFKIFDEIAKEIGWIGQAVCDGYIRYLQRKVKNSTPNAEIQNLISELQGDYSHSDEAGKLRIVGFIGDFNKTNR